MIKFLEKRLLNNLLYKISIKNRLIFYFILSVLIPTTIVSTTIYVKSTKAITKKIDFSIEKNMNMIQAIIQEKIAAAKDISTLIMYNINLKPFDILTKESPLNTVKLIGEITELDEMLYTYTLSSSSDITNASIIPRIYINNRPEYNQYHFSNSVFDSSVIDQFEWFKKLSNQSFLYVGFDNFNTSISTLNTLKFARKIYDLKPAIPTYTATLTIDIETKYFSDLLESLKTSKGGLVFIVDADKSIILSNTVPNRDKEFLYLKNIDIPQNHFSYFSYLTRIEGKEMLISLSPIKSQNWIIIAISPINELNEELNSFRKVVYITLAVCMILSFLTALLLASDIVKPIQRLVKSMSIVKNQNFDVNITYKRNDEFAFLINHYKKMVCEIKELIEKLNFSEKNKQNAELKALQAQINPHFLYNTLDSINWLAIKHKEDEISKMVKSLSNFFRYSLNKGNNIILWADEIRQIQSYLEIQKFRFRNKLNYVIQIPDELTKYYTVKLIIQPIVENAILHGIEKKDVEGNFDGRIEIIGEIKGELVEILISDNGIGADVEILNKIFDNNADSSFGLKNVNLRIKQYFGDQYGLKFSSNYWGGLSVKITVPAKEKAEVFND